MEDRMMPVVAILACRGRRGARPHRPRDMYVHTVPWPLPPDWSYRGPRATLTLACDRCTFKPRPSDAQLREWIGKAAGKPDRTLYIDGP